MKVLLKRFHLNVQASVCDFIAKRNATTLYKSIHTINIYKYSIMMVILLTVITSLKKKFQKVSKKHIITKEA